MRAKNFAPLPQALPLTAALWNDEAASVIVHCQVVLKSLLISVTKRLVFSFPCCTA